PIALCSLHPIYLPPLRCIPPPPPAPSTLSLHDALPISSRIPPGQTLTAPDRWPLLHFGPVPRTDIARWDLKIFGAVEHELTLDYGEIRALPKKDVVADIHCVTSWSRLGDTWTGVPIKEILDRVKPKP